MVTEGLKRAMGREKKVSMGISGGKARQFQPQNFEEKIQEPQTDNDLPSFENSITTPACGFYHVRSFPLPSSPVSISNPPPPSPSTYSVP